MLDSSALGQLADADALFQSDAWLAQPAYDMLLVADLFEKAPAPLALALLDRLLGKAKKQVLVLCEKLSAGTSGGINNGVHRYHPVLFRDYDFSYLLLGREHENQTQLYSFYPKRPPQRPGPAAPPHGAGAGRPLRLAYILPDNGPTGGVRQLLTQAREMHRRGHRVLVYTKSATAQSALPRWSDVTEEDVDGQFVLKPNEGYLEQMGQVDAILLGWMEQAPEVRGAAAPVLLWEQGSSPLFGDFGQPLASTSPLLAGFRACYQPPVRLLAVSPLVQAILRARFGRASTLLHAAVEAAPALPDRPANAPKRVLLVGNGERAFKNFSFAIEALVKAKGRGHRFEVHWITPTQPARNMVPKNLKVDFHIAPRQRELPALYGGADIVLSHPLYAAFPLPPLEAMAAGTPVLAVNSGGIETYAVAGENCLLCEQGDMPACVEGIERLLTEEDLRARLAANGRATAGGFSVAAMCDSLEGILRGTVG